MKSLKLGRLPRAHNHLPTMNAVIIRGDKQLPPPPMELDNTKGMAPGFGMMLNDKLGDCTCAAIGHAIQLWTFGGSGNEQTPNDSVIQKLYEEACGYNPKDPDSDQGGVEQDVLAYIQKKGIPPLKKGGKRHKISGYLEVDFRSLDDLKRTIADFGVAYIGIEVPESVMAHADDPNKAWVHSNSDKIVGGHAVILVGYDLDFFYCISWGNKYKISHNFLGAYLEEAYAIIDSNWITSSGVTPLGMTLEQLKETMQELR